MTALLSPYRQEFFQRPTVEVARDLIGARLCRRLAPETVLSAVIVETEAYTADDPASHAFRGLTPRSKVMFGPAGHAYVYFIYGMYHCLNVVTEPEGTAGAVLIRAVAAEGANGPGRLCRAWQIDASHNGRSLLDADGELWIGRGEKLPESAVGVSPRIGISVAQERPWRFFVAGHPSVSVRALPGSGPAQKAEKKAKSKR